MDSRTANSTSHENPFGQRLLTSLAVVIKKILPLTAPSGDAAGLTAEQAEGSTVPLQGHLPVSTGTMTQSPVLSAGQILKHLIKQGFHPCTMPLLWKSTFVLYFINKIFIKYKILVLFSVPFLTLLYTASGE